MTFSKLFRAGIARGACRMLESKSVERLADVRAKQLLTSLRSTGLSVGPLQNFSGETMRKVQVAP